MMRTLVFVIILAMAGMSASAQGRIFLSGEVRDRATNIYLPNAQCKVYDANGAPLDSVRAYGSKNTGSGRILLSSFAMQVPKQEGTYTLEFIYPDFDTTRLDYELKGIGKRETVRNVGTIYLNRHQEHTLNELTVTATKVMFYHKGDTIVYNADAFNLSEGSMLDALVGALPGVEIRDGGRIFVNGRYVESLLLDGKEFFKGNNQIMLNNLGAYTVKDIRVYEKMTDMNKFVGNDLADGKQLVMDVKLKQEFKAGSIINIEAGGGTSDRYLGRLFAMHFVGDNRFTLLGNVNNLDKTSRFTRNSHFFLSPMPSMGETTVYDGGFDYNVALAGGELEGNLFVTGTKATLNSTSSATNYLQDETNYAYKRAHSQTKTLDVQTDHKYTRQSAHHIYVLNGSYKFQKTDASSGTASMLTSQETATERWSDLLDRISQGDMTAEMRDSLINQSLTLMNAKSYKSTYAFDGAGNIRFDRIPDWIGWGLKAGYNNWHSGSTTERLINYGDPQMQGLGEKQRQSSRPNSSFYVDAFAGYNYRPSTKMLMTLGYGFRATRTEQTSDLYTASILADATGRFDLAALRQMQEEFEPSNSYRSTGNDFDHRIVPSLTYAPSNFVSFRAVVPLHFYYDRLNYNRGDIRATPSRKSVGLSGTQVSLQWITRYDYDKNTMNRFDFNYNISTQRPDLVKTIDIVDDIDPLNVFLGNPGLKNSWNHSFSASYLIGLRPDQTIQINTKFSMTDNELVSGYWLDPTSGQRLFKTYNVGGNYNFNVYLDYWKELSSKFTYRGILIEDGYCYSGMYGEGEQPVAKQKSHAYHTSLQQGIKFSPSDHEFGLTFYGLWRREITPSRGTYNMGEISADIEAMISLPFGLKLKSDLFPTKRMGYTNKSLNKFYPLWNASLTCSLGKGRWLLGVYAYDILRKMDNVEATMNANGRVETYYNYIPRYVMATVQFRFNHTPAKTAPEIIY